MPIPLIVIGGVILLFLVLLLIPIRIVILWRENISVTLRILCFRRRLYPQKPIDWKHYSKKKADRLAAKQARKAEKKSKKVKAGKNGHLLTDDKPEKTTLGEKLALVRGISSALIRKTQKKLRLVAARLHISVATGDAAKTAVLYGVVCQSLAYLLAALDRVTKLKAAEPEVAVTADYLAEKPSVDVKLVFSVRVAGAIALLITAALSYLRQKQQIKATRKKKQKQKAAAKAERATVAQKGTHHG